jgi:hypothetical protein
MNYQTLKNAALADWGPTIERIARAVAVAIAATYAAGWLAGDRLHKLNDWMAPRLAAVITGESMARPAPVPVIVRRQAAAVASPGSVAEPPYVKLWRENAAMHKPPGSLPESQWRVTSGSQAASFLTVAQLRVMARQAGYRSLARSGRRTELLEVLGM